MKIFLSHSSRDKSIVREVKNRLPPKIKSWLDEDELVIGDDIKVSLKKAIHSETDFVIFFISKNSLESDWVKREIKWAIEKEKELDRTIILPVLLDEVSNYSEFKFLEDRLYVNLTNQSSENVLIASEKINKAIFSHLITYFDNEKAKIEKSKAELISENKSIFQRILDFDETMQKNPTGWLGDLKDFLIFMEKHGFDSEKFRIRITSEKDKYFDGRNKIINDLDKSKTQNQPNIGLVMYNVSLLSRHDKVITVLDKCLLLIDKYDKNEISEIQIITELKDLLQT